MNLNSWLSCCSFVLLATGGNRELEFDTADDRSPFLYAETENR
jgi:hypothetical protein